jgi:hypothetical protein
MNIFIVRLFLHPDNPLTVDNLKVFSDFEEAKQTIIDISMKNKLKLKGNLDNLDNLFSHKNRYYMYEDFLSEQYIWIEKHVL